MGNVGCFINMFIPEKFKIEISLCQKITGKWKIKKMKK